MLFRSDLVTAVSATIVPALENERLRAAVAVDTRHARSLPSGPVTFLMTDIVDSTGHLERLADAYPVLLAEVRGVLRSAVRRAGGREIDARADEYFAVFEQPHPAIHAALAIERRLRRRTWPAGGELRLRYGLHHGRPMITDSGYVGLAVNATARVSAAGHGGQILITRALHDAIKGDAGARIRLRHLGSFQLRGLRRPDTLYQVIASGLERDFPPLRAAVVVEADA